MILASPLPFPAHYQRANQRGHVSGKRQKKHQVHSWIALYRKSINKPDRVEAQEDQRRRAQALADQDRAGILISREAVLVVNDYDSTRDPVPERYRIAARYIREARMQRARALRDVPATADTSAETREVAVKSREGDEVRE